MKSRIRLGLYWFLVALPFAALLILGGRSRGFQDTFVPLAYGPETQSRLNEYRDVAIASRDAAKAFAKRKDPETLYPAAEQWIRLSNEGRLRPIYPLDSTDTLAEGLRGVVLTSNIMLSNRLLAAAINESSKGRPLVAKRCALLSLKVAEAAKWSDYYAMNALHTEESRTLALLQTLPLSTTEKLDTADQLNSILLAQGSLDSLKHVYRERFRDEQERKGVEVTKIEEPRILLKRIDWPAGYGDRASLEASQRSGPTGPRISIIEMGDVEQANLAAKLNAAIDRLRASAFPAID